MILLDFKIDEQEVAKYSRKDIAAIDYRYFTSTILIMPIRFRVGKIDLFESMNTPWADAPILDIASTGLIKVKN